MKQSMQESKKKTEDKVVPEISSADVNTNTTTSKLTNDEKIDRITLVLKSRMNPRELADAVSEIKTILES